MYAFIKYVYFFILCLICLICFIFIKFLKFIFKGSQQEKRIEIISQKNDFDNIVIENNYVISVFYIDSCNHCHKFLQDFDKASKDNRVNKWKFIKVSCKENPLICESLSVNSYPTIKTYKDSKEIIISPPRELNSFIKFLNKVSDDPFIYITSREEFYEKYGVLSPIIEFKKNGPFFNCIYNLSHNEFLTDFYFGLIEIKEKKSYWKENKIKEKIIFGKANDFNWNGNCDEAKIFLYNNIYPLINTIDLNFMKEMYRKKKTLFLLFYESNNNKINKFINDSLKKISRENTNKDIVFGYIDIRENKTKDILEFFEINKIKESNIQIGIYNFLEEKKSVQPLNDIKDKESFENKIKELLENIHSLKYKNERKQNMFLKNLHLKWKTKIIVVILSLALLSFVIFFDYPKIKIKINMNKYDKLIYLI
jgi:thiol-disulfide isomerase/thioredoxin